MSLDLHNDAFLNEDQTLEPSLDVHFLLILAGMFFGGVLTIHVDGNITPTLIATSAEGVVIPLRLRQKFHGLSIFVVHRLAKFALLSRFPSGSSLLYLFLLNVMAELLLSTLKVANVHLIISEHSRTHDVKGSIFRHIFSLSIWSRTFPAALLYSACSSVCFYLPIYMARLAFFEIGDFDAHRGFKVAMVLGIAALLYFGSVVPSYAVFIRVAASILPMQSQPREREDTSLRILTAWQSFSRSACISFFKSLSSVLAMEMCLGIILATYVFSLFHPALHQDVVLFLVKYAG